MSDEVIAEVRRVRHEISLRCGHDVHKLVAYYREFQEEIRNSGSYRFAAKTVPSEDAERDHPVAR